MVVVVHDRDSEENIVSLRIEVECDALSGNRQQPEFNGTITHTPILAECRLQ